MGVLGCAGHIWNARKQHEHYPKQYETTVTRLQRCAAPTVEVDGPGRFLKGQLCLLDDQLIPVVTDGP